MTPAVTPAGTTWAGSHAFAARGLVRPASVAEVQELVVREPRLRALGSRHSFTDLADTDGLLVSTEALGGPELDGSVVRLPAGMRYGDLAVWLHARGRALPNLASLPHISVAGAVATGTHGAGLRNGSLATSVTALELVDGRGELVRLDASSPDFAGAVVGLGALGIVAHVELETVPAYDVVQVVHEGLTWPALLERVEEVLGLAYSVSVFTRWTEDTVSVWTKALASEGTPELSGARPAAGQRHMIDGLDPTLTTPQLGVPGPWHERIPHFRLGFQPSAGDELQSEYLVPLVHAREALEAVRGLGPALAPVLLVAEVRGIAGDGLWVSGAYGTDTVGLHFTWRRDHAGVLPLLPLLEERLLPLGARPHWGKVFAAGPADLAPLYPRWDDFRSLVGRYDPAGRFRNAWLDRTLG